jgi:uncharacterized protein
MKMFRLFMLICLVVLLAAACDGANTTGSALSDPVIPKLTESTGWWIDTTGKMSPETRRILNQESEAINHEGYQLGGVIWSNSQSDGIELATKFGNENKLGSAGKDNGLAIAVFIDKSGKNGEKPAISVAVGSGLEGLLNDAKVGRFLDQTFVPARKEGKWEEGLVQFVQLVHKYLQNPSADEFKDPPTDYTWVLYCLGALLLLLLFDGLIFHFAIIGAVLDGMAHGSGGDGGGLGGGGGFSGGGVSR